MWTVLSLLALLVGLVVVAVNVFYDNIVAFLCRRDDRKYYVPYKKSSIRGVGSGTVHLNHSKAKLRKASDTRGLGCAKVSLYYETTKDAQGEEVSGARREHFLLLHSTGSSSQMFHKGQKSVFECLREAGHDVTAVDLRGHGRSSVPAGPYSIQLFALDVAEAMAELFGEEEFHVVGVSIGFGVAMALSLFHADQVKTVSGNGFLYDRTRFDPLSAFATSSTLLPLLLGRPFTVFLGEIGFGVEEYGLLQEEFKHQQIKGVLLTVSGWSHFNVLRAVSSLRKPTLIIHPEKEWQVGNTRSRHLQEISMMPPGLGELVEVKRYSHWMVLESGGSERYADLVLDFIQAKGFA